MAGFPVIISEHVPAGIVVMINADDIYLADDGEVELDYTDQASLEMDTAPTISSTATVRPAQLVSLWQTNSAAFRAERMINWARREACQPGAQLGVSRRVVSHLAVLDLTALPEHGHV